MLSNQYDYFIEEKPCWIAKLSDGTTVYQDDDRPGEEIPSAWLRLKDFCGKTKNYIIDLHLRFRTNIIHPFDEVDAEGYFFSNKIVQVIGANPPYKFFVLGIIKGETIFTKTFKVPELILIVDSESERPLDKWKEFTICKTG